MDSKIHYTEVKSRKKFLELWDELSVYKRRFDMADIAKRMNLTPAQVSSYVWQVRNDLRRSYDINTLELIYNHLADIVRSRKAFIEKQKEELRASLS